ncbi:MAG: VOC family protein [Pseudorhizobium sp.]
MNHRSIDHLVLPVAGLPQARTALQRLGFTVAPDARHPFGTENACVFLPDGAYLEPLAIADRATYDQSADAGNVFTARDRQVRRVVPDAGLSGLVLATDDAVAEDAGYRASGVSAGEILEFSRKLAMPDGGSVMASFRLAFAAESTSPAFFLFACQRINALPRALGALVHHINGVSGLREVVLSASSLAEDFHLLETALAAQGMRQGDSIVFSTRNGFLRVVEDPKPPVGSPADGRAVPGLRGHAVVFAVADLAVTEAVLAANDVPFLRRDNRLTVAAATGKDVIFAFEE